MARYSTTARVSGWGSAKWARLVTHLTADERDMIRRGRGEVRIAGCPPAWTGDSWTTDRRVIVTVSGRFVTRLPV